MHAIHDFTRKLRQPSLSRSLESYVRWRRRLRRAQAAGAPEPPAPPLAPISINLDLTTACNYRCTHCIDWDILNSRHKYREEELRASIQLMTERGLRSVILIGGGEPTLFPRFAALVAFLKGLGLQVAIVSNGSRGRVLEEAATHMGPKDWIRLSLDSGSNELFAKMHRPADPKVDLDAICTWVPRIKDRNPRVQVGYSYIIVWKGASRDGDPIHENIDEIVLAAERARRFRFDFIAFKPVLERRDTGAEVMDPETAQREMDRVIARIRAGVDAAKELVDDRFRVYESVNLRALELGNWRDFARQPRTCHMQAFRQVLSPMGLYNCPAHRGVEKARIAGPTAYRNADDALSTTDGLLKILEDFDASRECREVTCLYNGVNWWLEKVIEDPSVDVDLEIEDETGDYFL